MLINKFLEADLWLQVVFRGTGTGG